MAIRWIMMNPSLGYHPVGIIDQDRFNIGRQIHGIPILGNYDQFEEILVKKDIVGVVLSEDTNIAPKMRSQIIAACRANNRCVRTLKLEFEPVED